MIYTVKRLFSIFKPIFFRLVPRNRKVEEVLIVRGVWVITTVHEAPMVGHKGCIKFTFKLRIYLNSQANGASHQLRI